jgi:hypothetical protein
MFGGIALDFEFIIHQLCVNDPDLERLLIDSTQLYYIGIDLDLPAVVGEFTRLKIQLFDGLGLAAIAAQTLREFPARARCAGDTRCTPLSIVRSSFSPLLYSQTNSDSSTLL